MKWWIVIIGVLSNAAANAALKYAMLRPLSDGKAFPWALLGNIHILAGIFLYGIAFVFYALALKIMPLSVAYPVLTSGAMIMVALISVFFFKEPFSWKMALGTLFIICGVFFINKA